MVDGVEREVPSPRIVLRGASGLTLVQLPLLLLWGLPLAASLPFGLAMLLGPTAPPPRLGPIGVSSWQGLFALTLVVAVVGAVALERWARPRRRTVEVFADRLVVGDIGLSKVVFLVDLDTFEDRSSDLVRLRPRVGRGEVLGWSDRPALAVRAAPGDERTALIDTLLAAGLRRDDGAGLPARPPERPLTPRLVVLGAGPWLEVAFALAFAAVYWLHLQVKSNAGLVAPTVPEFVFTISEFTLLLSFVVAASALRPRRGAATLFDDRVRLQPLASRPFELGWGDVVGWRGDARAYVSLVLRPGLARETHGEPPLPTPTPAVRAAVEALLAERGVPRL